MLIREGTSRGADPVVTVLTISQAKKRGPSDALPYLSTFAELFAPLESNPKSMKLKVEAIPLTDVECVTETIIKVRPFLLNRLEDYAGMSTKDIYLTIQIDTSAVLKKTPEALALARDEFVPICKSWNYQDWEEVPWEKVKDVSFRETLDKRRELAAKIPGYACRQCPKFLEHVRSTPAVYPACR
jgi:antiviral helicase SKI2